MRKIFAVFDGIQIIKMSRNKDECVDYRTSFPIEDRRRMFLAYKIVGGVKEFRQNHWQFEIDEFRKKFVMDLAHQFGCNYSCFIDVLWSFYQKGSIMGIYPGQKSKGMCVLCPGLLCSSLKKSNTRRLAL